MNSGSLPASFYQAEAAWLEQPDYRSSPEDIAEDIDRVCSLIDKIIREFTEENICGDVGEFYETEESENVSQVIEGAKDLIQKLTPLMEELEEYEEESPRWYPDPDQAWDEREL